MSATWDRIWIPPSQIPGSTIVVQEDDRVFVVTKCCLERVASYYGGAGPATCGGCREPLPIQPKMVTLSRTWTLTGRVMWNAVPGWISNWTSIPKEDIEVYVDGARIK